MLISHPDASFLLYSVHACVTNVGGTNNNPINKKEKNCIRPKNCNEPTNTACCISLYAALSNCFSGKGFAKAFYISRINQCYPPLIIHSRLESDF